MAQWRSDNDTLLDPLVRARIAPASRYAVFFGSSEGHRIPGTQVEEVSGCLVDETGRLFDFWLGWDPVAQTPTLTRWRETTADPAWADEPEYQDALAAVGLA